MDNFALALKELMVPSLAVVTAEVLSARSTKVKVTCLESFPMEVGSAVRSPTATTFTLTSEATSAGLVMWNGRPEGAECVIEILSESESLVDDGNGNQESVDENDASTDALAPGCLGAHCFDSETGRCVSKDSQFLLCDDEVYSIFHSAENWIANHNHCLQVICESDGTAGLQVAASVPKYTSPAGITGGFLTRGRFRRLCHKWGFLRRLRKWRCLTSTKVWI